MHHHIIVSGDDALATTIIEELKTAGASVVRLATAELHRRRPTNSAAPRWPDALAVVCAGDDDAANLEIALLARKANPTLRVVARLANDVLREAVADDNGPGAILDVAELTAPSVVEACLAHRTHPFEAAGIQFVVSGSDAPRDATLREIYGELAPVAVIHGDNSSTPGEIDVCPTRDQQVHAGDRAVMIGTVDESASRGIRVRRPTGTRSRRARVRRVLDAVRTVVNDFNPAFYPALAGRPVPDRHFDDYAALQLPAPANVLGRRLVLHHRDDHDDGLRRLQLRPPRDVATSVRCHVDVRRRDHHRSAGRVHCRRAACRVASSSRSPARGCAICAITSSSSD